MFLGNRGIYRETYPEEHKPTGMSGPMNISYIPRSHDTKEHNRAYVPQGTKEHKPLMFI
jgi:hypothetical protein